MLTVKHPDGGTKAHKAGVLRSSAQQSWLRSGPEGLSFNVQIYPGVAA